MPTEIVFRAKPKTTFYGIFAIMIGVVLLAAVFAGPAQQGTDTSTIASP